MTPEPAPSRAAPLIRWQEAFLHHIQQAVSELRRANKSAMANEILSTVNKMPFAVEAEYQSWMGELEYGSWSDVRAVGQEIVE